MNAITADLSVCLAQQQPHNSLAFEVAQSKACFQFSGSLTEMWDTQTSSVLMTSDERHYFCRLATMASPMETQQGQEHRDDNTGATKGSPPHKAAMQTNIPQNVCNMSHAVLASVAFHWPDEVNQSKLREWTQLILAGSELLSATAKHSHLTVALGYERQQPTPQYV